MPRFTLYRPAIFESALTDFNRHLESFFDDLPLADGERRVLNHLPLMDVRETDAAYVVEAELPGYDETAIEVQVNSGVLTIASKNEPQSASAPDKQEGAYILRERRRVQFSRSLRLPENADPEQITAVFKNGILNLELKKHTETQKRVIQINKS
jgi:HSP20 family molecular chaperone IbpA